MVKKSLRKFWVIISALGTIWTFLQLIGIYKIIVAWGLAMIYAIWSVFQHLPTPQTILYTVLIFGSLLWINIGVFKLWNRWKSKNQETEPVISIIDNYEEYTVYGHEVGLVFKNTSENNIVDCQARLLDFEYEIPQGNLSLRRLLRTQKLVCDERVAGYSNGKLPLVKWGTGIENKSAEFIYNGGTEQVAYSIANTPILLLLNIWADNVPATYVICKLSDRMWGGYDLSILKSGLQKENPKIDDFQILDSEQ